MYVVQSKIFFFGSKPLSIEWRLKTTTNELKCLFTAVACLLFLGYMAVGKPTVGGFPPPTGMECCCTEGGLIYILLICSRVSESPHLLQLLEPCFPFIRLSSSLLRYYYIIHKQLLFEYHKDGSHFFMPSLLAQFAFANLENRLRAYSPKKRVYYY